ncbi:transglutaminase-like domain-containing protein [Algirhabdus cladophorae]|uniref:transglutaminase-like domain-containing protein n=1 Tax=Algirhabdus cladophorae TaxID=3377108 RepID=UPI003B84715F
MDYSLRAVLSYRAAQPCDALLQIEAATDPNQTILNESLTFAAAIASQTINGEGDIGIRRWLHIPQNLDCVYEALVRVTRPQKPIANLPATAFSQLPGEVNTYLMPSRYCHPEQVLNLIEQQFSNLQGGSLIQAMSDWIFANMTYDITASHAGTAAHESLTARSGVCRDFAHILITLARGAGLPARYVSAYGPAVSPQDFHALVEVFLDGAWHLVDPTGMTKPDEVIRIGVGRDAADVSFLTSYGFLELKNQSVAVHQRPQTSAQQ